MTTTRPYFNAPGEQLIALILAGDKVALAEAAHRRSPKVRAAVRTIKAQAPAKAPRKAPAKVAPAKPLTTKALAAIAADKTGAKRGSAAWWSAYRASTAAARAAA